MNKYHKNIVALTVILMISLFLFAYWLNLNFGYGQMFLLLAGVYGIYLNCKEAKLKERELGY